MKAKSILDYYLSGDKIRFDSVAKAFDLGNIDSFHKGKFILERSGSLYQPLLTRMALEINTLNEEFSDRRKFKISETTHLELQPFFESSLHFLKVAYKVEKQLASAISSGLEKPGGIKGFGITLAVKNLKAFTNADSRTQLRKLLELIIDPTEIDIPMERMENEFGFPKVGVTSEELDY